MSLMSNTPNMNLKSFWERPEGKTGLIVLGLLATGAGLTVWYYLLPLLTTLVSNTLYLIGLCVALAAVLYLLFDAQFRVLVKYGFKSVMRWLTSKFVEIDPIGILKTRIFEMKKKLSMMNDQITNVSSARQQLKDNIANNSREAEQALSLAQEAKRKADAARELLEKQKWTFKIAENSDNYSQLTQDNKELGLLLNQVEGLYQLLQRMSLATQFYINTQDKRLRNATIKRKSINAAFDAMRQAKGVLRGSADEEALYDQTWEFLAEDASNKLGAIDDFARISEDYLANMDLKTGAANSEALKQLESVASKLLPPASSVPGFIDATPLSVPSPEAVSVPARKISTSGYEDLFK